MRDSRGPFDAELATIRSLHYILFFLSTAIILLAFSSRNVGDIDRAESELKLLSTFPLDLYLEKRYTALKKGDIPWGFEEEHLIGPGTYKKSFPFKDLGIPESIRFPIILFWHHLKTVGDYAKFLSGSSEPDLYTPYPTPQYCARLFSASSITTAKVRQLNEIIFSCEKRRSSYQWTNSQAHLRLRDKTYVFFDVQEDYDEFRRANCSIVFEFGSLSLQGTPEEFDLAGGGGREDGLRETRDTILAMGQPYADLESGDQPMEALQPYLTEIQDFQPQEALRYLQGLRKANSHDVNLFGLSLDSSSLFLIAPSILFLVMLYSLVHLRHLAILAKTSAGGEEGGVWIGLLPGIDALCLLVLSYVILPTGALLALILRLDEPFTFPAVIANLAGMIFMAILSLRLLQKVLVTRRVLGVISLPFREH